MASGLSLAELAGDTVSRAFVHQVETGAARPSMEVLEAIAERTGRSVAYFMGDAELPEQARQADVAADLVFAAKRVERLRTACELDHAEQEGLRMVEAALRGSARFVAALARARG